MRLITVHLEIGFGQSSVNVQGLEYLQQLPPQLHQQPLQLHQRPLQLPQQPPPLLQ